MLQVTGHLL